MKMKRYMAVLFSVMMLASCSERNISDSERSSNAEITSQSTSLWEEPEDDPSDTESIADDDANGEVTELYIRAGDFFQSVPGTQAAVLFEMTKDLEIDKDIERISAGHDADWETAFIVGNDSISYARVHTEYGWKIVDKQNVYYDSSELTYALMSLIDTGELVPDVYYTCEHDEPITEEEYLETGVYCVKEWLTSLQSEDTPEYSRNNGFEIADDDRNAYLSCGMVNGKKEFVCEICFNAQDCGDDTFYDSYYQEGRYTAGGKYWSGNYICARFRWEDGKCSLIGFETRDGSDYIQQGLNGIVDSEYKNFFEFARYADLDKAYSETFEEYSPAVTYVSKNVTRTADGEPIDINIYCNTNAEPDSDGNITEIWDFNTSMKGEVQYSTGLYFTDNSVGHMEDTLPSDFKLTFDNYDGDANPDFCVRYMEDAEGTYYTLKSVQSDGRVFNLSGRAFEGGIYVAGCDDPSPRLQRTKDTPYIGWKVEGGEYYPIDSYGNRTTLPEINMYPDRAFLPDDMKLYSQDEDTVTCFVWNNTADEVKTSETYSIEIKEGDRWVSVAEGLTASSETIPPRGYAEISYDISAIEDRKHTAYRIVAQCGEYTGYGEFICEGEGDEFTAEVTPIISGKSYTDITVNGNDVFDNELTSAVLKTEDYDIPLVITKKDTNVYSVLSKDMPQRIGKYELILNGTVKAELEVNMPVNEIEY